MLKIDINCKLNDKIVIALGFFDSLHIGHKELISKCKKIATNKNIKSAIFTFNNNPLAFFDSLAKEIFTYEEREFKLQKYNLDYIVSANFDNDFANLSPVSFFNILTTNFNIDTIIVGEDYTFGKNAKGDILLLQELCDKANIALYVASLVGDDFGKIASRDIREYLKAGKLQKANYYLGEPYFIIGVVNKGRGEGKKIGFPTINIKIDKQKLIIKEGVYVTNTIVDGKKHLSITNVGAHPTFDDYNCNIETYIIDFNSDLYNKKICVEFVLKIRDIKKFDSVEALKNQLTEDSEFAKKGEFL
ncbi:MAG: bifunctional riboflavin kinase/FAD synthetase [Clostridia bacterium]